MRIASNLLFLLAVLFAAPAVHARTAPLVTHENLPVTSGDGKPMTAEQVRKAIITGGSAREWTASGQAPGTVRLSHTRGKHTAVVDVVYTTTSYSIRYVSSVELNYGQEGGATVIHPTYNNWVRNLRMAIDGALKAM